MPSRIPTPTCHHRGIVATAIQNYKEHQRFSMLYNRARTRGDVWNSAGSLHGVHQPTLRTTPHIPRCTVSGQNIRTRTFALE